MVPRRGLDGTTHIMQANTVTGAVTHFVQNHSNDKFLHQHAPTYKKMVVQRGHDATPIEVAFGSMAGLLAPHARYIVLEDGKWVTKKFEEMKARTRGPITFGR